jgi:4-diphosphocytidyl-2-C-methyl-D-erythritol kinase
MMITLKAPAKINWSLYVLDRRDDGYHNIISLMQKIAVCDTLTFEPAGDICLASSMNIPLERNLVFRAARALQTAAGVWKGASICLVKEIPEGAGLGGGSSDAAAALVGLNELWGLEFDDARLRDIGATLGSDVPFFIGPSAAIVRGRGETLVPEYMRPGLTLLVVKPDESISTASAYRAVAQARAAGGAARDLTNIEEKLNNIRLIIRALNEGPISGAGPLLVNDFGEVAAGMIPVIGEISKGLLRAGAVAALLSGSGSAVFGLFEDRQDAERASGLFRGRWNRVTETL